MKIFAYLLALAVSPGINLANADSLSGNGGWQSWGASGLVVNAASPNLGTPYWNNSSGDGPKANVGWCLTGGGNCAMAAGPQGVLSYFGNGSAAPTGMYFTSSGSPVTVSLETLITSETTGNAYDVLGYYVANSSGGAPSISALTPLFNATSSTVGSSVTIQSLSAGENYGFYIEDIKGAGTPFATDYYYFMDSTSNMATGSMPADTLQDFAAFSAGGGNYFVGDVDADKCQGNFQPTNSPCVFGSEFDYNDMVLEVSPGAASSAPEPASLFLLASGLLAVGAYRRKSGSGRQD